MSILISASASTSLSLSDAANAALDSKSFFLSQGNWWEHLSELFLEPRKDDELEIEEISAKVEEYIAYLDGKTGLTERTQWHLMIANKLRELIATAREHGCDRICVAG